MRSIEPGSEDRIDPLLCDVSESGKHFAAGTIRKGAVRRRHEKGAMVIPQEAVNELQGGYQVAVVDQNNKASIRPVKMGERIGAMWEVNEGLKPGDRVIVQGAQKVREGSPVKVKEWTPPSDALISKSDQAKSR